MNRQFAIGSAAWVEALRDGAFSNQKPIPEEPKRKFPPYQETIAFLRDSAAKKAPARPTITILSPSLPLAEFNGRPCPYCQNPMLIGTRRRPTRDHIHPRSRGGKLTEHNKQIICSPCNGEKSDMTDFEFRHYLRLALGIENKRQRFKIWREVKRGRRVMGDL